MRRVFSLDTSLGEVSQPRNGLSTSNDIEFTRAWWEPSRDRTDFCRMSHDAGRAGGAKWFPFDKGGEFRRWYGNLEHVVNWEMNGQRIRNYIVTRYPYLNGNPGIKVRSSELYFRPHLSFSSISSGAPAFREYPHGTIFGGSAKAFFTQSELDRRRLLGVQNSNLFTVMLEAVAPTLNFEAGQLAALPMRLDSTEQYREHIDSLVKMSKNDWESFETSQAFMTSPLVGNVN